MSNQVTPETKKASTVLDKSSRALAVGQVIEFKGREFAEISAQTDAAARDAKIELDFRVRENEGKVLAELLRKTGQVATTDAHLADLNNAVSDATTRANQAEFAAVKDAEKALHAKYGSEIAGIKADHRVEQAELNAQAKSDATTIQLLKGQVASLEETITAMREAEVQKAEAASKAAGVVINVGK